MIKIWQGKSVNAAKATWPKRMQSVCKAYGTLYGTFQKVNMNGSVALTQFFLAAKNWHHACVILIEGSDEKGVTL